MIQLKYIITLYVRSLSECFYKVALKILTSNIGGRLRLGYVSCILRMSKHTCYYLAKYNTMIVLPLFKS
jgi:hypothetical protein